MQYFKGNIINVNKLPDYNYSLNIIKMKPDFKLRYDLLDNTSHKALLYYRKYSSNDLKRLADLLKRIITFNEEKGEKEELDKTMANLFHQTPDNVLGISVIYERVYDENGNMYGKELITGAIFPINMQYSSFDVCYSLKEMENVYYDIDNNKGYYLKEASIKKINDYCYYLIDFDGNKHGISYEQYKKLKFMDNYDTEYVHFDDKCHMFAFCDTPLSFNICLRPNMTFLSNQRIEYVIGSSMIANELEMQEYVGRFNTGFGKKKRKKDFEDIINNMFLSNYLGEINFVSNSDIVKERVSESTITKEMQELEYLLLKLKSVSIDDYNLLNKEYLEILNQDDSLLHLNALSINSIISLQNRAKLTFLCHGGQSKMVLKYLEDQVNSYLDNYNAGMGEKTRITLDDLDKLSNYFLNSKNSYTIKEQNEILRCLSLLYLFEIYENKNVLNTMDLRNSYVADNIKRILVVIGVLHDLGIIKEIPNGLYDINDLEDFLEFVKRIEFNEVLETKGNELIKKIQQ